MSGTLSRELLKWLQSLGLSTQVRNPRRDLSNGYAVAEVFAAYYPQEVELFSFENASGERRKAANWELLYKFFRKRDVPITRDMIDATLHARPDAAVALLETAYAFLTNKTPSSRRAQQPAASVAQQAPSEEGDSGGGGGGGGGSPAFARPTASKMIKERADIGDTAPVAAQTVAAAKPIAPAEQRTRELIEEHERVQRTEREQQQRGSVNSLVPSAAEAAALRLRRQTKLTTGHGDSEHKLPHKRAMTAPTDPGNVHFREVQVRACDVDPLVLRARAMGATPRGSGPNVRSSRPASSTSAAGSGVAAAARSRQQSAEQQQSRPATTTTTTSALAVNEDGEGSVAKELARSIEGTLLANEFGPLRPVFEQQRRMRRQDYSSVLAAFADALPWLPTTFVAAVLGDVRGTALLLADFMLVPDTPALSQLLNLAAACCIHARECENSQVCTEACLLLAEVGAAVASKDGEGAAALLERAAPECVSLLLQSPPRTVVPLAAALLRSLCSAEHGSAVFKTVLESMHDLPPATFAWCLRELAAGGLPAGAIDAVWSEACALGLSEQNTDSASVTLCLGAMAEAARTCSADAVGDVPAMLAGARAAAERCGWWEALPIVVDLTCRAAMRSAGKDGPATLDQELSAAVDALINLGSSSVASSTQPLALAMAAVHMSRSRCSFVVPALVRVLAALPVPCLRGLFGQGTTSLCPQASRLWAFTEGVALLAVPLFKLWSGQTPTEIAAAAAAQLPASASAAALMIVRTCAEIVHAPAAATATDAVGDDDSSSSSSSSGAEQMLRIGAEVASDWAERVFVPLRDALYVELCRPAGCNIAAELLEAFFADAPRQALETMPMLLAAATVLGSDAPEAGKCRPRAVVLLSRIAALSAAHRTAVTNLVLNLPPGLPHAAELTPTLHR